jgi:hypothetical protein
MKIMTATTTKATITRATMFSRSIGRAKILPASMSCPTAYRGGYRIHEPMIGRTRLPGGEPRKPSQKRARRAGSIRVHVSPQ